MKNQIKEYFLNSYKKRIAQVTGIVIHYISAINVDPNDPFSINKIINIFNKYKVSADFLIARNGDIFRLVPNDCHSYHAGISQYPNGDHTATRHGKKTVNQISVGIELVGLHNYQFTNKQYNSLIELTQYLQNEHSNLNLQHIYGHEQVAIPLGRKKDPGPSFDWNRYKTGLGLASSNSKSLISKIFKFLLQIFNK